MPVAAVAPVAEAIAAAVAPVADTAAVAPVAEREGDGSAETAAVAPVASPPVAPGNGVTVGCEVAGFALAASRSACSLSKI
jgi:hypothetical protein